jgi:hypothetical protein
MNIKASLRSLLWLGQALAAAFMVMTQSAAAETPFHRIPTQYIAALAEPGATSGDNASTWGLWSLDPGPRGVRLSDFGSLQALGGQAASGWQFDAQGWWLEEHGLIMEAPSFPIPAGRYVVTGGREKMAVLTVDPAAADGSQHWALSDEATLYDVTHLGCRAALYTAPSGPAACTPKAASQSAFPVTPGAAMPPVEGCDKQDYQVLIVIGMVTEG